MKKNHNALTEHYLIPATLFVMNICLAHFLYAFTAGSTYSGTGRIAMVIALFLMGVSLVYKKQVLIAGSILFYLLIALAL
jgi:hypothetical protein